MRSLVVLACAVLVFASVVRADDEGDQTDVVVLTDANFDEKIAAGGDWLLMLYAPWCGHCKRLKPTWGELATKLKGKVNIAKVDCTVEKEVCQRYAVRGYPTVKFIHDGQVYDYKGARTIEAFTEFSATGYSSSTASPLPPKGAAPPPPKKEDAKPQDTRTADPNAADDVTVLTDADFAEKTAKGVWFVDFMAPWCGHCKKLAPTWNDLAIEAKKHGKFVVAKVDATANKEAAKTHGVRGFPTIKLFINGVAHDYSGARTLEAFNKFADEKIAAAGKADL
jgi:thioredoxin domain-containing protein 5